MMFFSIATSEEALGDAKETKLSIPDGQMNEGWWTIAEVTRPKRIGSRNLLL